VSRRAGRVGRRVGGCALQLALQDSDRRSGKANDVRQPHVVGWVVMHATGLGSAQSVSETTAQHRQTTWQSLIMTTGASLHSASNHSAGYCLLAHRAPLSSSLHGMRSYSHSAAA
jgi:hypothetical protein